MKYKLFAADMDGTLLNNQKAVTPGVRAALRTAAEAGKLLAFATGRGTDELLPYRGDLTEIRYAIAESGALLFDRQEEKIIYRKTFTAEQSKAIMRIARLEDIGVQGFSRGRNNLSEKMLLDLDRYGMAPYRAQYEKYATSIPDMPAYVCEDPGNFEKLSLYHTDTDARERTLQRLLEAGLCAPPDQQEGDTQVHSDYLEMFYAEQTSIELSPPGVHKGNGLLMLCQLLGVSPEETIAIGDNSNDTRLLEMSGLPLAVGNAIPEIKAIARYTVADNEHDGCAEAILKYLLDGKKG